MKKIILFWLIAAWLPARAQVGQLSSEERTALEGRSGNAGVDLLLDWAYDPQKHAREAVYARAALELAGQTRYAKGRSDCFVKLGHLALDAGRYGDASALYARSLHIRDSLGLISEAASCYNNLGLVQKKQSRYDSAAALFLRGLDLLKAAPADKNAIQLHNNLGAVLRLQGKYEDALGHFKESMAISRQRNSRSGVAKARLNLANLLQDHLGRFDEAHDSLMLSLADFSAAYDSVYMGKCYLALANNAYYKGNSAGALQASDQAVALGAALAKDDRAIALKNKGRYLLDQRRYGEAREAFQTALADFTALANAREVAAARFELGNLYYEQSKPAKAVEYYRLALDTASQDPGLQSRALFFLSEALDQLGRKEESARYAAQFVQSLRALQAGPTTALSEELTWFNIHKSRVKTELALRSEQNTRTAAGVSLAAVLAAALFVFNRQRQKRRLAEKEAELARQREKMARQQEEKARSDAEHARAQEQLAVQEKLEILKNKEVETTYARLEAQDERQQQIGQELHDNIGAMLTTVRLGLAPVDEVLDALPPRTRNQYLEANRLLAETCEELRRISHDLSSAMLMQLGLEEQLTAWIENIPLEVEFATHGLKERLDFKTELNIFRIVQELAHNVIKHARARNITIQVNRFENMINLMVTDDGCGFDVENARKKTGLGLNSLAARVHDLRGELHIDSRPGRGTTVSVDIPTAKRQAPER